MNRWLFLAAVAGCVLGGCAEERTASDLVGEEVEAMAQVATAAKGTLGTPCKVDADCQGGAAARCLTTVPVIDLTFPGGMCTTQCKTDSQCGTAGKCPLGPMVDLAKRLVPDAGALATEISNCLKTCTAQTDCRSGYECSPMPPNPLLPAIAAKNPPKFCIPPMPDAGVPAPGVATKPR